MFCIALGLHYICSMDSEFRLSILIPTFNQVCFSLVGQLHEQASATTGLEYEILVADDGSTDASTITANKEIDSLPHCRYIIRQENAGRSAIRNFLARQASYPLLLFIDSHMSVIRSDYLRKYLLHAHRPLVYGGYAISPGTHAEGNLRYAYEQSCIAHQRQEQRARSPYSNFHTSNFLVSREVMLAHPLDQRFKHYGYEDVLFGKRLREAGIPITHIDNPVGFDHFESNARFMEKTEEGLRTLHQFREELTGYSRLLALVGKLRRWHLGWAVRGFQQLMGGTLRSHLMSNHPSLLCFKAYRLGYFMSIPDTEANQQNGMKTAE